MVLAPTFWQKDMKYTLFDITRYIVNRTGSFGYSYDVSAKIQEDH